MIMNKLWMLVFCTVFPLCLAAQSNAEYNRKGDEAMKRLDYSDARLFYSEGMSYCDMYSINQLTTIWTVNEEMRTSMHILMRRCLDCLSVKATENDTTAISLLIRYYTEGIGTNPTEEMADHWMQQLEEITAPPAVEPEIQPAIQPVRTPIRFFAGYTFSPFAPAGITIGGTGNRWGGYIRIRSNLSFQGYEAGFTGEGPDAPKEILLKAVDRKFNSYAVTGGMMFRYEPFYFSLGAGYWKRDVIYKYEEVTDTGTGTGAYSWYKKSDAPYKGIAADVDGMMAFGKCYVTAGCNLLSFTEGNNLKLKAYLNVGAGIFF
jgi:hypothetical protein